MSTPRLEHVVDTTAGHTVVAYRVHRAGSFRGRWLPEGSRILVGVRPPADGEDVVLVPRGRGRPRLGSMRRGRLFGAADEPCADRWWAVAGPLVGVERPAADLAPTLPLAA